MDFIVIICTQISSYKYRSEWTSIKTSIVPIRSDLMWSQCKCFCVWKNPEVVLCAIFLPRVPYNWWTPYNWWKQSLFLSLWVVQTSDHWFPSAKSWNHASSSLFVAIPEWWHALHPLFFFFFFFFFAQSIQSSKWILQCESKSMSTSPAPQNESGMTLH